MEVIYDDSDYSDDSEDLNEELDDIIADSQIDTEGTTAGQTTFLEELLECLCDLSKGKVDWSEMDVDDLVNMFFKSPKEWKKTCSWQTKFDRQPHANINWGKGV